MIVYRLVGRTAPWDWAASAEDKHMGTYKSMAAAHRALDKIQAKEDWRMEYSHFTIVEEEVKR